MKNLCIVFALFCAMVLMISCGGGSSSDNNAVTNFGKLGRECYPNNTCDEGLRCDSDKNLCVKDTGNSTDTGSDKTDSGSDGEGDTGSDFDGGDTLSDNGDTTSGGGDTAPDNGDSDDDSDDGDTGTNPAINLPKCSQESATPCIDAETDLIWSGKSPEKMHWADAVNYCKDLNEGGFNDWRLPTRNVLRSLVQNCDSSSGCYGDSDGIYSKFGDIVFLWSSTGGSSEAKGIYFFTGANQSKSVDESFNARCVRNLKCDMALFDPTLKKCVDPCKPESCDYLSVITDATCFALTYEKYSCNGIDPSSGLIWSAKASDSITWNEAVSYCDNLKESGYSDWRLPNISELRTLIQNCDKNEMPDGSCGVIDTGDPSTSCLSSDCDDSCPSCESDSSTGKYSKFGDAFLFWSSSTVSNHTDAAWFVDFNQGDMKYNYKTSNYHVRCVR